MAENTKIEWCDHTFNPWEGCTKVSPGCDNCYAESRNARFAGGAAVNWGPGARRRRTSETNWRKPLQWERGHGDFMTLHNRRQRVFCASLADVFDNEVPDEWREDLFELIRCTPHLDWLLLTKRPQNIVRMVRSHGAYAGNGTRFLPANVWLGTTVEDQNRADINIPALLRTRDQLGARVLFLSMEPLIGPVDLTPFLWGKHDAVDTICQNCPRDGNCECGYQTRAALKLPALQQVIVGGESGPNARPMHPDWARSLRNQCKDAGVPFLFKQWGEWLPGHHFEEHHQDADPDLEQSRHLCAQWDGNDWDIGRPLCFDTYDTDALYRIGKKSAGRRLDGRTHDEFPKYL